MENCNSNYYGLLFKCPLEKELKSCVYSRMRRLPSKMEIKHYLELTEDEKRLMINKHQHCLAARETKSHYHKSSK